MAETGLKPSARPSEAAVRRTGGTTRNAAVQGSERLSPPNVNARPRLGVKPPGISESPATVWCGTLHNASAASRDSPLLTVYDQGKFMLLK